MTHPAALSTRPQLLGQAGWRVQAAGVQRVPLSCRLLQAYRGGKLPGRGKHLLAGTSSPSQGSCWWVVGGWRRVAALAACSSWAVPGVVATQPPWRMECTT